MKRPRLPIGITLFVSQWFWWNTSDVAIAWQQRVKKLPYRPTHEILASFGELLIPNSEPPPQGVFEYLCMEEPVNGLWLSTTS